MNTQKGIAPIVVIVIAVVIVALGGFLLSKQTKKETPAAVETGMPVPGSDTKETKAETNAGTRGEKTVAYDAQGFSPKTITIKKGETVVWRNQTGKPASVASAVHPTHLLYPEFDQYKTDQRGKDEFRFAFEKVGTWRYHDHLNASMTGTVIVTE